MEKRFVLAVCSLLFFMGVLFITQSITGFYSWDRYNDFCTVDSGCSSNDVCCLFFEEDYGVCDSADVCSSVLKATKEEKSQFSFMQPPSPSIEQEKLFGAVRAHVEKPKSPFAFESVLVGLILIFCAVAVYFLSSRDSGKKRSKKK